MSDIPGWIDRPVILHATPAQLKAYKAAYERGWRTRNTTVRDGSLDRADARGEPHAWYDGYYDLGAAREKWHSLYCPDHDSCELKSGTEDHEYRAYDKQSEVEMLVRHMHWMHGLETPDVADLKAWYKNSAPLVARHRESRNHAGET